MYRTGTRISNLRCIRKPASQATTIYAHRERPGELLGYASIEVIRPLRFDRPVLLRRRLVGCADKLIKRL
jgi:hypothetical protein